MPRRSKDPSVDELAEQVTSGQVRAAARACRWVDDRVPGARELLRALYPRSRHAWLIGVTGTPGAGKSTLTSALVARARAADLRVGVVAVDPSSPFSGGAILGDRIRMQDHFGDPGVFIRSVATRGALGGLSRTAADVAVVLAAWGADVVFLETVGVGQDELEVTFLADTTLVVVAPGLGDDVQALKAGILECADVFAVNKADRPGADAAVRDLELMLVLSAETQGAAQPGGGRHGLHHHHGLGATPRAIDASAADTTSPGGWVPPIVRTVATRGEGVEELFHALSRHRAQTASPERARSRLGNRLRAQLRGRFADLLEGALEDAIEASAARLVEGVSDPYTESEALWRTLRDHRESGS